MKKSLLAVAAMLLCAGCRTGASDYLAKGRELYSKQQFAEAALNYRKALQKDPGFAEAYYQLGLAEIRLNHGRDAFQHLSQAVKEAPAREDIKLALGDFSLTSYLADSGHPKVLYDAVARLADQLLAQNPESYDGLRWKGDLAAVDNKFAEAEAFFQRANKVKPNQPELLVSWSHVLFQDKQPEEAERVARRSIERNRTYGPAYDELFAQYTLLKKSQGAEQILQQKVANNPADSGAALQLAEFYGRASRETDMRAALGRMLSNSAVFSHAYLQVGDFYENLRRWDEAIHTYEQGAQTDPAEKLEYLKRITNVLLVQDKAEQAAGVVSEIRKSDPADDGAKAVQASLLIKSGKPEKAAEAAVIFRDLVKKSPENATWHFNLGRALEAQGDTAGAKREYEEAIQRKRNFLAPRLALVHQAQQAGEYQSTLQYANDILTVDPNMPLVRLIRAQSLVAMGRIEPARKELEALRPSFPDEVLLQFALVDLKQRRFKDAEEKFQKVLQKESGNSRAITGLVQAEIAQNQLENAAQFLRQELERSPSSDTLRLLSADVEEASGRLDAAIQQYRLVLNTNPRSAQVHLSLGRVYELKGMLPKAIEELRETERLAPKDPVPPAVLAHMMISAGRNADALSALDRALALKPNNAYLMNDLAYLTAETGGDMDAALALAQKAVRTIPAEPEMSDTLAWIYFKKNQNDSALKIYRGLVAKYPEKANFRYHFGMALLRASDNPSAQREFQAALALNPSGETRQRIEAALGGRRSN